MNIYVGNLPFTASEDDVRQTFAEFGQVTSVAIIKDKFTGESRGFGFVEMPESGEAQAAITALNGQKLKGRTLTVNEARPRTEGAPRTGGGGGGGGGRGGGGYGSRSGGPRPDRRSGGRGDSGY